MELPVLKCFAQFAFEGDASVDGLLHLRIEEAQGIAAELLGLIHGDVGLFQQLIDRLLVAVEQSDADAGCAVVFVRCQAGRVD